MRTVKKELEQKITISNYAIPHIFLSKYLKFLFDLSNKLFIIQQKDNVIKISKNFEAFSNNKSIVNNIF